MHCGRQHLLKETAARGTVPQQLVGLGACISRERQTAPQPLHRAARREPISKVYSSSFAVEGQIPGLPQLPEVDGALLTRMSFQRQNLALSRRTSFHLALSRRTSFHLVHDCAPDALLHLQRTMKTSTLSRRWQTGSSLAECCLEGILMWSPAGAREPLPCCGLPSDCLWHCNGGSTRTCSCVITQEL